MLFEPNPSRSKTIGLLAASWCISASFSVCAGEARPEGLPTASLPQAANPAAEAPSLIATVAESTPPPSAASGPAPSSNVTINLINRLVQKGVLGAEDAAELIKQAEADAMVARAQAVAVEQVAASVQNAPQQPPEPDPYLDDSMRVTYIPENVKAELRDQIRAEVMDKARRENWAAPRTLPEWTTRIRLFGDIRVRYDGSFFDAANDNSGAFPNFNAINTGAPFDISGTRFAPQLNVDQTRNRIRLRARLGVEAQLENGFSAGLRIATGDSNSPVSTNQSFGLASQGQGGNFSKYSLWLDRGYLRYQLGDEPDRALSLWAGRFDNPFFTASEIVWDDDVGFDGVALQARYRVVPGLTPFMTAGAFPVFNTDYNFATNQPAKFKSTDKWLYGGQMGVDWKARKDISMKLAAGYYHFDGVEGRLSDPYVPLASDDAGNTDNTRPSFAQKGNTYRPLRQIVPSPLNNFGSTNQYQYFGLATPFHEMALSGRLEVNHWEPFQISVVGEWVKNLAFNQSDVGLIAVNNRGSVDKGFPAGRFVGGDTAWLIGAKVGAAALQKAGDWQVGLNYRYVESDAVVDGLTDSDFGLGGTNLKGFSVFGSVALSPRMSLGLRWMSAQEVAGPPLKVDVLEVSYSGKF